MKRFKSADRSQYARCGEDVAVRDNREAAHRSRCRAVDGWSGMTGVTGASGPPDKRAAVRMSDVALHAGVALGTVSNALNHPERVTPAVRDRVIASISALGFVPNRAARSLAVGRSNTVAFVLADISNSFFVDMARGAEQEAAKAGRFLVLANADVDQAKQLDYIRYFGEEQVEGILVAPLAGVLDGFPPLDERTSAIVVLDADPDLRSACSARPDNHLGGRIAAEHLLSSGRRRIAFVGGATERSRAIRDRHDGAFAATLDHGAATFAHFGSDDVRVADGESIGRALLDLSEEAMPDGIVAAADLVAQGLLQSILRDGRYRFPDDIALIACDDNRAASDSVIPISTVNLPGLELGQIGIQLLLAELAAGPDHRHRHITISPDITARESSIGRAL